MILLCADIVHSINTWPNQSKFQITTAHRANLPTITEIFPPQLECGLTRTVMQIVSFHFLSLITVT